MEFDAKNINAAAAVLNEGGALTEPLDVNVLLRGRTRIGKTTLVEAIKLYKATGNLPKRKKSGKLDWSKSARSKVKGKSGVSSDTIYAKKYEIEQSQLRLGDTAGILDNRQGKLAGQGIAAIMDLNHNLSNATNLKVVPLCFSYSSFMTHDNAAIREELKEQVAPLTSIEAVKDNLCFLITRPPIEIPHEVQLRTVQRVLEEELKYIYETAIPEINSAEKQDERVISNTEKYRQLILLMLGRDLSEPYQPVSKSDDYVDKEEDENSDYESDEEDEPISLHSKWRVADICDEDSLKSVIDLLEQGLQNKPIDKACFSAADKESQAGELIHNMQTLIIHLRNDLESFVKHKKETAKRKDERDKLEKQQLDLKSQSENGTKEKIAVKDEQDADDRIKLIEDDNKTLEKEIEYLDKKITTEENSKKKYDTNKEIRHPGITYSGFYHAKVYPDAYIYSSGTACNIKDVGNIPLEANDWLLHRMHPNKCKGVIGTLVWKPLSMYGAAVDWVIRDRYTISCTLPSHVKSFVKTEQWIQTYNDSTGHYEFKKYSELNCDAHHGGYIRAEKYEPNKGVLEFKYYSEPKRDGMFYVAVIVNESLYYKETIAAYQKKIDEYQDKRKAKQDLIDANQQKIEALNAGKLDKTIELNNARIEKIAEEDTAATNFMTAKKVEFGQNLDLMILVCRMAIADKTDWFAFKGNEIADFLANARDYFELEKVENENVKALAVRLKPKLEEQKRKLEAIPVSSANHRNGFHHNASNDATVSSAASASSANTTKTPAPGQH